MRVRRGAPFDERLAAHVDIGDCWVWTGARTYGYGRVMVEGRSALVHRWVYENLVDDIPEGHHLDHLCRNKPCCNPDHLEVVTPLENTRRGSGDYTRGTCKHGHPAKYRRRAPTQTYCLMCRTIRKRVPK